MPAAGTRGSASTAVPLASIAVAAKDVGLDKVEAGIDSVLQELREKPGLGR